MAGCFFGDKNAYKLNNVAAQNETLFFATIIVVSPRTPIKPDFGKRFLRPAPLNRPISSFDRRAALSNDAVVHGTSLVLAEYGNLLKISS